jgi:hypothetical protein
MNYIGITKAVLLLFFLFQSSISVKAEDLCRKDMSVLFTKADGVSEKVNIAESYLKEEQAQWDYFRYKKWNIIWSGKDKGAFQAEVEEIVVPSKKADPVLSIIKLGKYSLFPQKFACTYSLDDDKAKFYFVKEKPKGINLQSRDFKEKVRNLKGAGLLKFFLPLFLGLEEMEKEGMVFDGFHPSNILYSEESESFKFFNLDYLYSEDEDFRFLSANRACKGERTNFDNFYSIIMMMAFIVGNEKDFLYCEVNETRFFLTEIHNTKINTLLFMKNMERFFESVEFGKYQKAEERLGNINLTTLFVDLIESENFNLSFSESMEVLKNVLKTWGINLESHQLKQNPTNYLGLVYKISDPVKQPVKTERLDRNDHYTLDDIKEENRNRIKEIENDESSMEWDSEFENETAGASAGSDSKKINIIKDLEATEAKESSKNLSSKNPAGDFMNDSSDTNCTDGEKVENEESPLLKQSPSESATYPIWPLGYSSFSGYQFDNSSPFWAQSLPDPDEYSTCCFPDSSKKSSINCLDLVCGWLSGYSTNPFDQNLDMGPPVYLI